MNNLKSLKEYFDKSGSDKSSLHQYEKGYQKLLPEKLDYLLEIGIANGHVSYDVTSLTAWSEIYPDAKIVGADIVPEKLMNRGNISSYLVDQSSLESLLNFKENISYKFDVIIDDGSHVFHDAKLTFDTLFECLADNGIYIIEDIGKRNFLYGQNVSDWENYARTISNIEYGYIDTKEESTDDDSILFWIKRK